MTPESGGRLQARDGSVTVELPAGAAAEPLRVRYRPTTERSRGPVRIVRAFHLEAASASSGRPVHTCEKPLTITTRYTPDELARAGLEEASLGVYYLDEAAGAWIRLASAVDSGRRLVTGTADHFGIFAVGGETFETGGAAGTAFTDTFADRNAWTLAAGNGTVAANTLTTPGASGADELVVTNSTALSDLTFEVAVSDDLKSSSHRVGAVFHYTNPSNTYFAYLTNASTIGLYKVVGGATTTLATASQPYSVATFAWLKVVASGSTITVFFANDVSGAPGTYTQKLQVTDTALASGAVGVLNQDSNARNSQARFRGPRLSATLPQDWSSITQQAGHPGVIWDMVTAAHGGSGSLQLFSGNASFSGYAAQTGNTSVTGGTTHQVSGWIKTTNVSTGAATGAQIVLVEHPSKQHTTVNTALTGTNDWTPVSKTLRLGSTTTNLEVRVVLTGSGTANFDDIVATAQPTCGPPSLGFASGVILSPASDPAGKLGLSTGTAGTGSTTASVQSDTCRFTLQATAPASPSFPSGVLQAACDGQPPVSLVAGSAVTVCSGRPGTSGSARAVPITYTLNADWNVAAVTDAVLGIQWQVSQP